MLMLLASVAGLCLGPVLFAVLHRTKKPQLAVDGFVLVAVVGLVMLHVLPEAVEVAGTGALVAAAVGLILPLLAERARAMSHDASHGVVLAVAFAGLMLHTSLDGVGLAGSDGLGLAVVVHRIPVGLGVWWLVRPQFGRRWALAVLVALCGATALGYGLQSTVVAPGGVVWVQIIQALVAGSLLHVVLHQSIGFHDHAHDTSASWRIPGAIGGVAAAALVGILPDAHAHALGAHVFDLLLVASPVLVIGFVIALAAGRLPALNRVAPWGVALILVGALFTHVHTEPTALNLVAAGLFTALVLLSLAHQGPRDFLLVVLPVNLSAHDHGHSHDHLPVVAEPG